MTNAGGRTRLWLNDGAGRFTDATDGRMPATLVRFSWDLELVDVGNDFDLDVLVSCKRCAGSLLFRNDGMGAFEEDPRALLQYTNHYEFEAMDLDGDGFLDLVTINDGEIVGERGSSRREHVFRNDGEGSFRDATDAWWPASENIGEDDNVAAFLDFDSDGDADFLIGSLSGPDRLLVNDGTGLYGLLGGGTGFRTARRAHTRCGDSWPKDGRSGAGLEIVEQRPQRSSGGEQISFSLGPTGSPTPGILE